MNWRIVVAVVVAFVIGGLAGGLAEHVHVDSKKHKSTSPPATAVATDWYGTQKASTCPALAKWTAAGTAGYTALESALASKAPWATTRKALLAQISATKAALTTLHSFAVPAGKLEIDFLVSHEKRLTTALGKAASASAFLKAQTGLASARLTKDAAIVNADAKSCVKS